MASVPRASIAVSNAGSKEIAVTAKKGMDGECRWIGAMTIRLSESPGLWICHSHVSTAEWAAHARLYYLPIATLSNLTPPTMPPCMDVMTSRSKFLRFCRSSRAASKIAVEYGNAVRHVSHCNGVRCVIALSYIPLFSGSSGFGSRKRNCRPITIA